MKPYTQEPVMKQHAMKIIVSLFVLLLAAGCNSPAPSSQVAVVDAAKIFKESQIAKDAMKHLEALGKSLQAEAETAQKALEKEKNAENTKRFQQALNKYQSTMGAEQQRIVGLMDKAFQQALEDFRKEKNIAVILPKEAALSFDKESMDVTGELMKKLDGMKIDLSKK
jgi:outer membrane protein